MSWLIAAVTGLVILVARHEYTDWAPRLTSGLIRMASACHPDHLRMREEWEAEMSAIRAAESDAVGLVHASGLFLHYGLTVPLRLTDPLHVLFCLFIAVVHRGFWWSWLVPILFVAGAAGFDRFRLSRSDIDHEAPASGLFWNASTFDRILWTFTLATILHTNMKVLVARADLIGALVTALWVSCLFLNLNSARFVRLLQPWRDHRARLLAPSRLVRS